MRRYWVIILIGCLITACGEKKIDRFEGVVIDKEHQPSKTESYVTYPFAGKSMIPVYMTRNTREQHLIWVANRNRVVKLEIGKCEYDTIKIGSRYEKDINIKVR